MTRIATVGYLNARPLTSRIDRDRFDVVEGHPSDIAAMLKSGEVDVALVPVAAALTDGDFRVVAQVCIGAEGPVHSVLLVAETPPEEWTKVVLDGVSRTSRTLARLLLTQGPLSARVPEGLIIEEAGQMQGLAQAKGTIAGLVIGDAARDLPDRLAVRMDLAELWHEWTGLPFVFAVWAGRPDLPSDVEQHLREAGLAGLASRAQDYSGDDLAYVTESIRYTLDDRALIGLRRYAALAFRAGLVGTEDVQLYNPVTRVRARADVDRLLTRAADGEVLTPSELSTLQDDARTVDLTAAARMCRESRLGALESVSWTPGLRVDVTTVVRTPEEVAEHVLAAEEVSVGEVALVGPLHLGVGTDGWCRWIAAARQATTARIRALSLQGLRHLSAVDDLDPMTILGRLQAAGLDGFAEDSILALDNGVRADERWLSPRQWLGLAESVLGTGIRFVTGLEVGAGEPLSGRIEHLLALDALHTRTGGVSAMRVAPLSETRDLRPEGATAEDYLRTVALARIAAASIQTHEAAWLVGAPGLAQAALHAGADTLGTVWLPDRGELNGSAYSNPRAQVGKPAVDDPWSETFKAVRHHLKRSGFASERLGASVSVRPSATGSSPQPRA
ncbi:MAG: MqnA/MqnD/SBP family protein [Myxococcota bacterium]